MDNAVSELKAYRVSGILATAIGLEDKALQLEKELGTDPIYTMIAMGETIVQIASSLGLSTFEMNYILKRTPDHRKNYANAVAFNMAENSSKKLEHFSKLTGWGKEDNFAAKHHASMVDTSLKILNMHTSDKGSGNIVVNNTVVVRSKDDVPSLPDELKEVIEGDYVDVES